MKKISIITALLLVVISIARAQSNKEEIELYQSIFGMEKKAVVAEFIKLEGDAGNTFWRLYDEYETQRKLHGQKRIALMNKYAAKYMELDDASTQELMNEMIALGDAYDKLIKKYYKSISKEVGIKPAAQFFQLEAYFQSVIRLDAMESIPFIGEFDV